MRHSPVIKASGVFDLSHTDHALFKNVVPHIGWTSSYLHTPEFASGGRCKYF
jgi:hypothetical protein